MKFKSCVFLSLIFLTTGCAKIWNNNSDSLEQSKASDAAVGAGIGAVVGGGLGLLVGSTSGAPTEGLLVGTLAGGALGAGIGAQVNKDNATSSEQRLTEDQKDILKRSQKIKQQNLEIEELKSNKRDLVSRNQPVIDKHIMEDSFGKDNVPILKPNQTSGSSRAYSNTSIAQKSLESRGRLATSKTGGIEYLSKPSGTRASAPYQTTATNSYQATTIKPTRDIPESIKKTVESTAVKKEIAVAKVEAAKLEVKPLAPKIDSLPPAATVETKVSEVAKTTVKQPKDISSCKDALKEAERGLNAATDADRLFYLRRASRLCPTEPTYHVELGKILSSVGKREDAKYEFRQAIDLDPHNQIARDELSSIENAMNINKN